MDNVIHLFPQSTPAPPKDVSNESYFFTFVDTTFHFGGGAFTRDLLERLDANRDRVKQLVENDSRVKRAAIANVPFDDATKTMLDDAFRAEGEVASAILDTLKTPNELDDYLSDDDSSFFMPLVLAATIHACYVPFDLLRMQRSNWCLIEGDASQFMAALDAFFNDTHPQTIIFRYPEGSQS